MHPAIEIYAYKASCYSIIETTYMPTKFIVFMYIVIITWIVLVCTMLSKVYSVDIYSNNYYCMYNIL